MLNIGYNKVNNKVVIKIFMNLKKLKRIVLCEYRNMESLGLR
jgi:hypothetical protein